MPYSQNGYPANDISLTEHAYIPGTERKVRLRKGAAGQLLRWFAGRFDKLVESIDNDGELDDWGYAERPIRGGTQLSNHASGTALDLNAPEHPLGAVGTFSAAQVRTIRALLRQAQGCIRWGGDYSGRKDEMHFEIVKNEQACATALAAVSGGGGATPGVEDDMSAEAERKVGALHSGMFYGSSVYGREFPGLLPIVAETQRRVTAITSLIARQNGVNAEDIAEALAPRLSAELLPTIADAVRAVLGEDNRDQAAAIVDEVSRRLVDTEPEGANA